MAAVYLNKNVRFQCPHGNAVYFKPMNGASKVTVSGTAILLNDCKLQLVGSIRTGQCPYTPNPATNSPPGPCLNPILSGDWQGVGNITISGKQPLASKSSMRCPATPPGAATIKPFKPTCKPLTVDDSASRISVKIGTSVSESAVSTSSLNQTAQPSDTDSGQVPAETREAQSPQAPPSPPPREDKQDSTQSSDEYTLCAMNRGEACKICKYRNASHVPAEAEGSKNAAVLKVNMASPPYFNDYARETGKIEQLILESDKTYSIAHHHLIPVNQCFKEVPELVKLANYYGYDINNALNGICLPTATDGYNGQSAERRREVAFYAMRKLKLQWHVGGHQMTIPDEVSARLPKPFQSYKVQVDKMLDLFVQRHFKKSGCRAESYDIKAKKFCADMDTVCNCVRERVLKFGVNPRDLNCIYVSKMSLYYAFYKELKEYQDSLFKDSTEATNDE